MSAPQPFPCPHCDQQVAPGSPACPTCGLRLVGPEAARLWQVNQQLGALRAEADHLVAALLRPAPLPGQPGAPAPAPQQPGPYGAPYPNPYARTPHRAPRKALTGQQLLLGLGALLLLSGVSFFLLVIWFVVGLVGQAAIMVLLTGAAVTGAAVAVRRRLPAAAETAAAIATGLLVLDLWAAHRLGLAGLGDLPTDAYWAGAGLLGALLLLGFDRLVPDGTPLVAYRPAATTLLAFAAWSAVAALDPSLLALAVLALLVALLSLAAAALAHSLDRPVSLGGRLRLPWSALPLLGSAVIGLTTYAVAATVAGFDPASSAAERYGAMALLALVPAALLVASRPGILGRATDRGLAAGLASVGVIALVPALGIPVMDAHRLVLAGVSIALAAVLVTVALLRPALLVTGRRGAGAADPSSSPAGVAVIVGLVVQPLVFVLVGELSRTGIASGLDLLADRHGAGVAPWWLPVVPGLAWAVTVLAVTVRTRSARWAVVAHLAVAATVFSAVRDAEDLVVVVVALVAAAGCVALAAVARTLPGSADARLLDATALGFAAFYGANSIAAALSEAPWVLASVLVFLGVLTCAYAGSPGRLPFAYLGSLLVTSGVGVLLEDAAVTPVEAYTAPLVVMLAVVGLVQWSRDHGAPTALTMGPALSAAVFPSLAVAVDEGSSWRLAAVTLVAIALLVAGLVRRLMAPVSVGVLSLVVVAVTQGGPLMAYVDGWVILVGAGALLLAVGVAWERAVLTGRRVQAWYGALA